jgi:hypothetical protein
MNRPLAGSAWRAQSQRQQLGRQSPGSAGLHPALKLMLALQAVKALQGGIELAELIAHRLLKQRSAWHHQAISLI